METLPLRLPRPKLALDDSKRRVNVYLRKAVAKVAKVKAAERYGYSLSELVDRLLEEECRGKKGLLQVLSGGPRSHVRGWRALAARF